MREEGEERKEKSPLVKDRFSLGVKTKRGDRGHGSRTCLAIPSSQA